MFSGDQGRVWEVSPNQPFLHEVRDRDGKEVSFSTRERPKLIFTDGRPTHLVTGVSPLVNCAPTPRVDCKTAPGGWWTFTLIQPLGAAAPSTESDITTTEAVI
uniref:Uncharacterized protein n=1 Tax=Chromera velia CCMP2878 TaxID=1169474 RepID=A0A0G4F1J7_9ALVE|eukprot:Cvel_14628.t1-p1 / transcript=Cvel_14628.t1 / gene=Cvel_14628 / organism=Chromera_velia_CCMP2878 / gene_product=hypothetical protein / transcript_product=hypothetical protein / location=Cvel_scaffold1046:54856-55161(+) / protein_length=102 / sequence_SO=supercontig / SO=protein_coding / is_pseudo=false